jgi:hypothetical protein
MKRILSNCRMKVVRQRHTIPRSTFDLRVRKIQILSNGKIGWKIGLKIVSWVRTLI